MSTHHPGPGHPGPTSTYPPIPTTDFDGELPELTNKHKRKHSKKKRKRKPKPSKTSTSSDPTSSYPEPTMSIPETSLEPPTLYPTNTPIDPSSGTPPIPTPSFIVTAPPTGSISFSPTLSSPTYPTSSTTDLLFPPPTAIPTPGPDNAKMSGSSSSSVGAIVGAVVGSLALLALVALFALRYKQKQRSKLDYAGVGHGAEAGKAEVGEIDVMPRTAFRHESFMALVKDAAKGFYVPELDAQAGGTGGNNGQLGSTSAAAGAAGGAGAGSASGDATTGGASGASASEATSQRHPSQSGSSGRSLQYLHTGSPSSPPPAHAQPGYQGFDIE